MFISQAIWEILAVSPEITKDWNETQILVSLDAAQEALEFGGRTSIAPVLLSLKHILCRLPEEFHRRGVQLLESCWNAVLDLRRNELFWPSLSAFVAALMQPSLVLTPGWAVNYALKVRTVHIGTLNSLAEHMRFSINDSFSMIAVWTRPLPSW